LGGAGDNHLLEVGLGDVDDVGGIGHVVLSGADWKLVTAWKIIEELM
jgi:hypothetical protein